MNCQFGIITSHMSEGFLEGCERIEVETPWGKAAIYRGQLEGVSTALILRYGDDASIASHRINYCANLWAMKLLGVTHMIAQNAIGSVNPDIRPGDYIVPHDFIDFTKNRPLSFFEKENCWVRVDLSEPFCPDLRGILLAAAREAGVRPREKGVFICTEGPRFETPAEVRYYREVGGDIIGTPMVPEVILAREAGICYASIAMVINMATGLAPSLDHSGDNGIITYYKRTGMEEQVEAVLRGVARTLPAQRSCGCGSALEKGFHGSKPDWM